MATITISLFANGVDQAVRKAIELESTCPRTQRMPSIRMLDDALDALVHLQSERCPKTRR